MTPQIIIETARIQLTTFTSMDAPFILELTNSPDWLKYIGDRNIKDELDALEYLENGPMKNQLMDGFSLWAMRLKAENNKAIGMCGLVNRAQLDLPDLGFALLPEYYRKGYTFEAGKATLQHAKQALNLKALYAITLPKNKASIGLLQKLDFQLKETKIIKGDWLQVFYQDLNPKKY